MRFMTLFTACMAILGCEEETGEPALSEQILGAWSITNMGQYALADCSGDLDYTFWAVATTIGFEMDYTFNSDGTADIRTTAFGLTDTSIVSWEIAGDQLCIEGECAAAELDGDTFTIVASEAAYCENDMGEVVDGLTMSACEAADYEWTAGVCYELTATKQ